MDPHTGPSDARTWPIWTVASLSLLAYLWMSDADAQADALKLFGNAPAWEAHQARAFVGRWYVVAHRAPLPDTACTRDLTVDYRLRGPGQFDYLLRCTAEDGRRSQHRGVAGWDGDLGGEQAPLARQWRTWWGTWLKAFTPAAWERQDIVLVDHAQGLAAVSDRGAQGLVLLGRSPVVDEAQWQPFLDRLTAHRVDWEGLQSVRQSGVPSLQESSLF